MTPEALVEATAAPVNALGAKFYFDPETVAYGKENHSLDGFRFYIVGRGGVLGKTSAAAVSSAFGYFNPGLIQKMWDSGCERADPVEVAASYLELNANLGRAALGAVDGLDAFCDAAEASCASVDGAGLSLYAGTWAQPLPDDVPGRAMQLVVAQRELRGSLHLAALIADGFAAPAAHAMRRPDDVESFGWPEAPAAPSDGVARLAAIDEQTDRLTADAYRNLTERQRSDFAAGIAAMTAAFADA